MRSLSPSCIRPHALAPALAGWTLGVLLAGIAPAQPWAGTAGAGIEVRGGGRPVADARVELAWLGGRQLTGPGALLTDSSGRVEIGEIAEGRWLLRVRHPDFMGYDAEVEVQQGKKPQEGRASVIKIGDSTTGLQIRYFKVEGPARTAPTAAPIEPPVTSTPRTVTPSATSTPPSRETAEPSDPARPMPEAETARLVTPGPADTPTAPTVSRNVRSARGGGCFDCRPGEWATHALGEPRPPGGAACPETLETLAGEVAAALGAEPGPELDRYAGPLFPLEDSTARARRALSTLATPFDVGCQIVAVKLPKGARLAGLQMEIASPRQSLPCLPDGECPGRVGRFAVVPRIEHTDFGTIVIGAFEHEQESREAPRLTVYFQPPGDWAP